MGLYLLLLFWLATTAKAVASQTLVTTKAGCPEKCGSVQIPYPFGIGDSCKLGLGGFNISCNNTYDPPKPFRDRLEVLNISLLSGLMRISYYISFLCYTKTGSTSYGADGWVDLQENQSFTFSETHNKFTAIGCDTVSFISGPNFTSGCMSFCRDSNSVINGSCSGAGCCQNNIPKGLKGFGMTIDSLSKHTNVWSFNPCSFAFLADQDVFSFNALDLIGKDLRENYYVPAVLEWAIGNEPCEIARKDSASFACVSENSYCYNINNGSGYRCNCAEGFRGNPYLGGGCQAGL